MTVYTIGRNMKAPIMTKNMVIPASPPAERLSTTLCFLVLSFFINQCPTFDKSFFTSAFAPIMITNKTVAMAEA